jgi:hypothetical protein
LLLCHIVKLGKSGVTKPIDPDSAEQIGHCVLMLADSSNELIRSCHCLFPNGARVKWLEQCQRVYGVIVSAKKKVEVDAHADVISQLICLTCSSLRPRPQKLSFSRTPSSSFANCADARLSKPTALMTWVKVYLCLLIGLR